MAIKNIICSGIGFSAGSTKWMPTLGFSITAVIASTSKWIDRQSRFLGRTDLVKTPFLNRRY